MEDRGLQEVVDSFVMLFNEMEEDEMLHTCECEDCTDGHHTYSSVLDELEDTYLKKNSDYGNSFEDALDEFGEVVGLFMLKMKYDRMTSLFKKGSSEVDESIIDSLDDMINYGIMFSAWLKNKEC